MELQAAGPKHYDPGLYHPTITTRVPPDLRDWIDRLADMHHVKRGTAVRWILEVARMRLGDDLVLNPTDTRDPK
jgi:hypothetical protein